MKVKKEWFTREYLSERTLFISLGSLLLNFFMGIVKIIIAFFTMSYYFCMNGLYNVFIGIAKTNAVRKYGFSQVSTSKEEKVKIENKACYQLCWLSIVSSIIYLAVSIALTFFITESANYGISIVCFIALVAFSKLITGIISSVRTRKDTNIIIHYIKLVNLIDGCIAISLTQRAILMMEGIENANYYSGIGGIVFSILALAISIYMIIELKYIKKRTGQ